MADEVTPQPTPDQSTPPPAAPQTQEATSPADYSPDHTNLPPDEDDNGYVDADKTTETQDAPVKTDAAAPMFKGIKADIVDLMGTLAQAHDLDLTDPKQFGWARALAEKESLILAGKRAEPPSAEAQDYMKEFEDPEPETPAGDPPSQNQREQYEPDYVKVAKGWKQADDITPSLDAAFTMDEGPARNKAVSDVLLGAMDKTFQMNHLPLVLNHVERILHERFGDVVADSQERVIAANNRSVVDKMQTKPEYADIMTIFEPISDQPIKVAGQLCEDTLVNRVLAENPSIMSITVKGKTPAETLRKSTFERYRVIHSLAKAMRSSQPDPKLTKKAFDTGAAMERSKRDPARAGLNSPGSRVPAGGRATSGSGGELSTADLFK